MFADSNDLAFPSAAANEFAVRATGGVRLVSAIDDYGQPIAGVELAAGSGSWSSLSAREVKKNLAPADGVEIVETLARLPISTWSYQSQSDSVRHIGPMAQGFYAAFGLGEDDQHISTVDANGIALVALQGLHRLVQEQDAQIAEQQAQIKALEAHVARLERALNADDDSTRPCLPSPPTGWLLLGSGLMLGVVLFRRSLQS